MNHVNVEKLAALRRFEPVLRFTRGERFFPLDIERYLVHCSLWVKHPNRPPRELIPDGELTVEKLIQVPFEGFGAIYYMKFIDPPDLVDYARISIDRAVEKLRNPEERDSFRAGRGRLARVGYGSRFVDALFSISLLARGRVPGDTAAAAKRAYRRMMQTQEGYTYYGRVLRENGWAVLQYWFFYPYNNWRSGFFGVNDHEADWEMVSVYCQEEEEASASDSIPLVDRLTPQWIAYASHDYSGEDLRRHWSDPFVEKVSDEFGHYHPVVYVGAGSHASYFLPGEYLTEIELPFLSPLVQLVDRLKSFWVGVLRQAGSRAQVSEFNVFRIPFVDYARGDGIAIGPCQGRSWSPSLINENVAWVSGYRGLWGLFVDAPIAGENAPAGPAYNRDGTVRRSWYDPIGWGGLEKVAPPARVLDVLADRREHILADREAIKEQIMAKSAALQQLGVEMQALVGISYLEHEYIRLQEQVTRLSKEVDQLRDKYTLEGTRLETLENYRDDVLAGNRVDYRSHLRRPPEPSPKIDLRMAWLADLVAAMSVGLLLVGLVLLVLFARKFLVIGLAGLVSVIIFLEAGFRRQLERLITSLTIGLAIVSFLILIFEFFWPIVVGLALITGIYIMWENLRELFD